MLQIRTMKKNDVECVAKFISQINKVEDTHIGYCGIEQVEIANSFIEDLTDVPYGESFITAYENNNLIGVIGFDADLVNKSVEIWGPFVTESNRFILSEMWSEMLRLLPNEIEEIHLFPNKRNKNCIKFASDLGFICHSEQTILKFNKQNINDYKSISPVEIREGCYSDFKILHNENFPMTYYDGQQIIDRINEHRKVFITKELDDLSGYIYVEAEPEFGEANIEFFAVKELYRGRGIGGKLLIHALHWLFTFDSISSVTLCVNSTNKKAISLYKKVGFKHIYDLCFFSKKIN